MNADERPVAAVGVTQAQQQRELLAGRLLAARVLAARGPGLFAYAYRLTLSEAAAGDALRRAAVTLRSGSPKVVDEQTALDLARTEIGRLSVGRPESGATAPTTPAVPALREEDLLRSGFHRRLHALPTLERQCWLLRHTGGHDVEAIAGFLRVAPEQVRSALAYAASALVEGELAEGAE
ncbi:hypothetical protein SAMN06295885_3071 [Rathayibacter oskolensis]|uniref:Sigma-70, region 4 n=1 Tax=Rathayibacter oskolensis TaxID=1891671 RepID=A0A1X7PD93_9MICO|nr:hypothetical protein [Rathayibacter oskolensis]SMH48565.1 hypothetical protein SAMN06295885_3071 [Rathayibacter oskolensis]